MNVQQKVRDDVRRFGRSVIAVFPLEGDDPVNGSFAYTIGNAKAGLPEVLVVGLSPGTGHWTVNELSRLMAERGRPFEDGEVVDLGGARPVAVVEAEESVKADFTLQATEFFGAPAAYAVLQAVVPDAEGRFPWQDDCAEPYRRVRVRRARPLQ